MGNPKENDGSIQSANLDGSDVRDVIKPGTAVHTPKQMAIDQKNQKIYCCDREGLCIIRCDFDGNNVEVIYKSGDWQTEPDKKANETLWPVGIALSIKHDKFFWTQKGYAKSNEGRICSAPLASPADLSTRDDIELVADHLPECIDLEYDDQDDYLYWTDRGELPLENTLNRKSMTASRPAEVSPLGRQILAQGLAACMSRIWVDWRGNAVPKVPRNRRFTKALRMPILG